VVVAAGPNATLTADAAVDVVIPVYNAADELARCVDSVLRHTDRPYRLVLIDDGSTDPAIAAYFAEMKRRALPDVLLLRNRRNVGFTGTANEAMRRSDADVVLLNSDTLVTSGWLAALARCAASDPHIGTVTPFSNNAEICSFPRFCENNAAGEGEDPEAIRAALARAAAPTYPCLPTGVGFCLYIRRELLDAIGVFDPAFGAGYGEENDFCMRALAAGYASVLCDDAYVLHLGARSFVGQKDELVRRNTALLLERHPRYAEIVREYIASDPLRPLRAAALAQYRAATGPVHGVLHILRTVGGGAERHLRALIGASRTRYRHYVALAQGEHWRIEEALPDDAVIAFDFRRLPDEPWPRFLGGIAATFRIDLVHLHDISGCREGVIAALAGLDLRHGCTGQEVAFALAPAALFAGVGAASGDAWAPRQAFVLSDDVPTVAAMAQRTLAGYDAACAAVVPTTMPPLSPARVRDALGYVPWLPPAPPRPSSIALPGIRVRLLRALQRFRRSLPGRMVSRVTPVTVREALKRRLS